MARRAEEYRYYSAGVGDLTTLSIKQLTQRIIQFDKVHREEIKVRIKLAGGK